MSLRPCVSCTRHVRNTETACPFCGANLPLASTAVPRSVVGLGRAAIMAFGMTAAACDSATNADAGTDAYIGGQDAAYGGPPDANASMEDAAADVDAGGGIAAYGTPAPDAGGTPSDAGMPQTDAFGGVGPLYGGAP